MATEMRAQAHTLEAFVAALLLISGLIFALQATAVTPLSASTSNQHIENQQRATIQGLLGTAAENGDLEHALLQWEPDGGEPGFEGAPEDGVFVDGGPPNAFGEALNETLLSRGIAFNVYLRFSDGEDRVQRPYVNMGSPSDNAVSATRTVGLYNSSTLTSEAAAGEPLEEVDAFYAPAVDDGQLYTVVEVRIVAWRK